MLGGQIGCDYQFAPTWVVGIEGAAASLLRSLPRRLGAGFSRLLRGSLTERFVLRQERGRTPSIVRLTQFSYLVGLPDVYRAFILIAPC
jgi:hypothetical protein